MNQERLQPVESGSTSYSSGAGVSFKTNNEDKATISISLPTSILKDQKHFQNVIETINNVLIHSPDESTVAPADTGADDSSVNMSSHRNVSPAGKVTSVPVSVLTSKANRKRNFSNEVEPYDVETITQTPSSQGEHKGEGVVQSSMDWEANNKKVIPATDNAMDWSSNTGVQSSTQQEPWESSINLQPWGGTEKKTSLSEVSEELKPDYAAQTPTFSANKQNKLQFSFTQEDQAKDSATNPSSVTSFIDQPSDKVYSINGSASTLGLGSDVYMTQPTEKVYVMASGSVTADLSHSSSHTNQTTSVSFQEILPSQSSGEVFVPVTQVERNIWDKSTVPALSSSDQSGVYNSLAITPIGPTYRAPTHTEVTESALVQQSFNQEAGSAYNDSSQKSVNDFMTPSQQVISEFKSVAAPNQPVTVFSVQHQESSYLPVSSNSMTSVVKSTDSVMFSAPITSSTNLLNSQTVLTSLPSNPLTLNGSHSVYMIPATSTVSSIIEPIASELESQTLQQQTLDPVNQYAIVTTSSSNPFQSQSNTTSFVLSQPSANPTPTNIFAESTTFTNPFQNITITNVTSSAESNSTQQAGIIITKPIATPMSIGSFNEASSVHSSSVTSQPMSYRSSTLQSDISANLFNDLPVVTGSQASNESTEKVLGELLNDFSKPANAGLLHLNNESYKISDPNIEFVKSDNTVNSTIVSQVPFQDSQSATASLSTANTYGNVSSNELYSNEMVSDNTNTSGPYTSAASSTSLTAPYTLDGVSLSALTSPYVSQPETPASIACPYDSTGTSAVMTSPYASAAPTPASVASPYTSAATPESIASHASATPTSSSVASAFSLDTNISASYDGGETHTQQDMSSISDHLPTVPSNKPLSSMDYEMSGASGGLSQEQSEYQKVIKQLSCLGSA